jgi:hypothetical protein
MRVEILDEAQDDLLDGFRFSFTAASIWPCREPSRDATVVPP